MDCGEVRKILYVNSDSDTPFSLGVFEAKRHVENCRECRDFFERESRLSAFLNERAPREKIPARLREQVLNSIAKERTVRQRSHKRPLARLRKHPKVALTALIGAVALLALLSILYFKAVKPGQALLVSELIEDHIKSISEAVDISSSEPERVESWFKGKVNFLVKVPPLGDAKLLGARLCFLRKWRAALLYYEMEGRPLSLFIVEGSSLDLSPLEKIKAGDKELYRGRGRGCSLVLWDERGLIYVVISDMKEEELVRFISSS